MNECEEALMADHVIYIYIYIYIMIWTDQVTFDMTII
jgi:hypothetical protein